MPLLRLRVRQSDGKGVTLLVARDGTVYPGFGYPEHTLQRLPGVAGLKLLKDGEGYQPVEGMDQVAELVDEALAQVPSFFRHWRLVDLSQWDPQAAPGASLIRVKSASIGEIVFRADRLPEQMARLASILDHIQRYQLGQPVSIDLSYGGEAIIRYK